MGKRWGVSGTVGVALVVFMLMFGLSACDQLVGPEDGDGDGNEPVDEINDPDPDNGGALNTLAIAVRGTFEVLGIVMDSLPEEAPDAPTDDLVYEDDSVTVKVTNVDDTGDAIVVTVVGDFDGYRPDDSLPIFITGIVELNVTGEWAQTPEQVVFTTELAYTVDGEVINTNLWATATEITDFGPGVMTGGAIIDGVEYDLADFFVPVQKVLVTGGVFNIVGEIMDNFPEGGPPEGELPIDIYPREGEDAVIEPLEYLSAELTALEGVSGEGPQDGDELTATIEVSLGDNANDVALEDPVPMTLKGEITVYLEALYPDSPHEIRIEGGPVTVTLDGTDYVVSPDVIAADMGPYGPETFSGTITIDGDEYNIEHILLWIGF